MEEEKSKKTQSDVDAYEQGRKGESDGSIISDPSEANVEGQKDKIDSDASKEEKEED